MKGEKTQRALARVDAGEKPFAAAKLEELSPNTLYVALKRRRERLGMVACPSCGTMVTPGAIKATKNQLPAFVAQMRAELARGGDPTTAEWIADAERLLTNAGP